MFIAIIEDFPVPYLTVYINSYCRLRTPASARFLSTFLLFCVIIVHFTADTTLRFECVLNTSSRVWWFNAWKLLSYVSLYSDIFCHGLWKFGFYFNFLRCTPSCAATSPTVELCVSAHTLPGAAVFWTVRSCKLICINLWSGSLLHYKLNALINLLHYL